MQRDQVLTALAAAVTVAGIVLAAVAPVQDLVTGAGVLGPVLFVLLCVLAAPAHLLGVLVALSLLVWPLPVAVSLSYAGGLLGGVVTAALLARAGAGSVRAGGPAWLRTIADRVARRPLLVGTSVRLVQHSGLAVEAFYLLTGYTRRQYLVVTAVGIALWIAQTVVGVTALAALVEVSPWLGLVLVVVPVRLAAAVAARRRTATRA